ncbi:proteasome regulatory subunit C-terminal-domain-containing protein [Syncephalis fuscata]|nr:proteasome regulatory subunit C-terminal-domain-containing protein [Syncephalis fuscata]
MADNNNPPRRQPSRRAKKEGEEEDQQPQQQQQAPKKRTTTTSKTTAGASGSTSKTTSTTTTTTTSTTRTMSRTGSSTATRRSVSNASSDAGAESSSSSTTTSTTSRIGRTASTRGGATSSTSATARTSRTTTPTATSAAAAAKKESTIPTRRPATRPATTTRTAASGSSKDAAAPAKTGAARTVRSGTTGTGASSSSSTKSSTKETVEYEMTVDSDQVPSKKPVKKNGASGSTSTDDDVTMATTDEPEPEVDPVEEALALVVSDITQNFYLLQKAVATIEARFTTRVIRTLVSIRRRMDAEALKRAIKAYTSTENEQMDVLLGYLEQADTSSMEVDKSAATAVHATAHEAIVPLPEIEMYLGLLVLVWLIDQKQLDQAIILSQKLVAQIGQLNRRTLDQIAARIFFYYARVFELAERSAEIRPQLLAAHRTANLRHDDESQATLINLLLRNYFQQSCRIKALQLKYTESHQHLTTAIRKAPQAGVQILDYCSTLNGRDPERSIFRQPMLRKALIPYLHLTQAVRIGDLTQFQETLAKYEATFHVDNTYTLILRLRHNVIKTGVRMINLSYSRISLRDICLKLHLDSEESAEYIVAKAIRDGVIDAIIDHEHGYVQSKENADIYATTEPQHAFDQRITFCLTLHDASVKAMRYPNSDKQDKDEEDAENKEEGEGEMHNDITALIEDLEDMDEDDMLDEF